MSQVPNNVNTKTDFLSSNRQKSCIHTLLLKKSGQELLYTLKDMPYKDGLFLAKSK
jgi:hypothetical protein